MAARNSRQKIEKALYLIKGIGYALSQRKALGMTAADADKASARMTGAEAYLRDALEIYEAAERRYVLRSGKETEVENELHTNNPDTPDNG